MTLQQAFHELGATCRQNRVECRILIDTRGQVHAAAGRSGEWSDAGNWPEVQTLVANLAQRVLGSFSPGSTRFKTFLEQATPAQREEVQRLLHRANCVIREVLSPEWFTEYAPHLTPAPSNAQTLADAGKLYGIEKERISDDEPSLDEKPCGHALHLRRGHCLTCQEWHQERRG